MTVENKTEPFGDPIKRTTDIPLIQAALRLSARDALRLHKRMGYPVAAWKDGQVVWIPPEEIPVDLESDE